MILKSSKAKGDWSFRKKANAHKIEIIVQKFAKKYGVKINSLANVGNHLHFHLHLSNRATYRRFIRAITAAIAMAVTGINRWNKQKNKIKFWDCRPFSRVVHGWRAVLTMRDYISINQLEGLGNSRIEAQFIVASRKNRCRRLKSDRSGR